MYLPLSLTLSRVLLAPVFIGIYIYHEQLGIAFLTLPYVLIALAVTSEVSDLLDGRLARRTNSVTDLGKLLDPMADSIFRLSMFFAFTQGVVRLPLLLVIIFFYRDSLVSTLRMICALRGRALAARKSGKIKAALQAGVAFLILILMLLYAHGWISLVLVRQISLYTVLVAVIYSAMTGVDYLYSNRDYIKKAMF